MICYFFIVSMVWFLSKTINEDLWDIWIFYLQMWGHYSLKKSHTCEGGANIRISVWHLLMKLKKNYLLKKLLKWAKKNLRILIFTMLYCFFKKIKKNNWRYHHFTPVYQNSWWYDLQFLRYRVWQTEIVNYGSFFPLITPSLKSQKIRTLKKWKKVDGDIILHICTKNHNHMRYTVLEIWSMTDRIFGHFGLFFTLFLH